MFKTFGAAILVLGLSGTAYASVTPWPSSLLGDWGGQYNQTVTVSSWQGGLINWDNADNGSLSCHNPKKVKFSLYKMVCDLQQGNSVIKTFKAVVTLGHYEDKQQLYLDIKDEHGKKYLSDVFTK